MLEKVLVDYGFTNKEAKTYIKCLELGNAPVSSIARLLKENRVTTYSILKNLVKKGIATEIVKTKTTYYSVISPKKLLKKLEDKYHSLKQVLPEFLAIANKFDNKPKVQFFEGFEGLKEMYNDMLEYPKKGVLSFLGVGELSKELKEYLNLHFLAKRIKIKMSAKVILCNNPKNKENYKVFELNDKKTLTEYKVFDHDFFKLYNEINIYGSNKVSLSMFTQDEMSGIIIHSKKLHDTLESIFNLIWLCGKNVKQTTRKQSK